MTSASLPKSMMDLTGQLHGRWRVVFYAGKQKKQTMWACRCRCGKEKVIAAYSLRSGNSRSCGCLRSEQLKAVPNGITHGRSGTKEYKCWRAMLDRCLNSAIKGYENYGGRGITVCKRWQGKNGFTNFLSDVGEAPAKQHQLDRRNNSGNYCPSNCRWATCKEQGRNRRTCRMVTIDGRTQSLVEWVEEFGLNYGAVRGRIYASGWTPRKALLTPVRSWGKLSAKEKKRRILARATLNRAVLRGDLVRPRRCECCGKARPIEGHHHEGYADPLNVRWLCVFCHAAAEQMLPSLRA